MCPQRDPRDHLALLPTKPPLPKVTKWHRERARLAALTRQLAYLEETLRQQEEGAAGTRLAVERKRREIAKAHAALLLGK